MWQHPDNLSRSDHGFVVCIDHCACAVKNTSAKAAEEAVPHILCIGKPLSLCGRDWKQDVVELCKNGLEDSKLLDIVRDLSGMFALAALSARSFVLITDPLGFVPVYTALQNGKQWVGTSVEKVACAAGCFEELDHASVAELLLRDSITFPFTTRAGVRELEPGSVHKWTWREDLRRFEYSTLAYYSPRESESTRSLSGAVDDLVSAIHVAGRQLTEATSKVGVMLSGGRDSRVVLASVPNSVHRCGITLTDWENEEVRIAREIADAAGAEHRIVYRSALFYVELVDEETELLGFERVAGNAHGLAANSQSVADMDLVIGGFASDTLLKACWHQDATQLHKLFAQQNPSAELSECAMGIMWWSLKPEVRVIIRERMLVRIRTIGDIRPQTASEWMWFYPMSRQPHVGYALSNMMLLKGDELFAHRDIIDIACSACQDWRRSRRLALEAFRIIGGKLGRMPVSGENGRPAHWGRIRCGLHRRIYPCNQKLSTPSQTVPWYTQGSWCDRRVLQSECREWRRLFVRRTAEERANSLLSEMMTTRAMSLICGDHIHGLPARIDTAVLHVASLCHHTSP